MNDRVRRPPLNNQKLPPLLSICKSHRFSAFLIILSLFRHFLPLRVLNVFPAVVVRRKLHQPLPLDRAALPHVLLGREAQLKVAQPLARDLVLRQHAPGVEVASRPALNRRVVPAPAQLRNVEEEPRREALEDGLVVV